jgi:hypothetical protein
MKYVKLLEKRGDDSAINAMIEKLSDLEKDRNFLVGCLKILSPEIDWESGITSWDSERESLSVDYYKITINGKTIIDGIFFSEDSAKKVLKSLQTLLKSGIIFYESGTFASIEEDGAILDLNEIVYAMYHHKKFEELEKFANDCRGKVVSKHTGIA